MESHSAHEKEKMKRKYKRGSEKVSMRLQSRKQSYVNVLVSPHVSVVHAYTGDMDTVDTTIVPISFINMRKTLASAQTPTDALHNFVSVRTVGPNL